jgi:hypothetical protein
LRNGIIWSEIKERELKMVKKSLIAILLIGMLASVSMAADQVDGEYKTDDGWGVIPPKDPVFTWEEVTLCCIPIYIDVGMYVGIEDCPPNIVLRQAQIDCSAFLWSSPGTSSLFPCYRGCRDFAVRSNFEATLDTTLTESSMDFISERSGGWGQPNKPNWNAFFAKKGVDTSSDEALDGNADCSETYDILPPLGDKNELQICVEAWNVNVWNGDPESPWNNNGTGGPGQGWDDYPENNYVGTVCITVTPKGTPDFCDYLDLFDCP